MRFLLSVSKRNFLGHLDLCWIILDYLWSQSSFWLLKVMDLIDCCHIWLFLLCENQWLWFVLNNLISIAYIGSWILPLVRLSGTNQDKLWQKFNLQFIVLPHLPLHFGDWYFHLVIMCSVPIFVLWDIHLILEFHKYCQIFILFTGLEIISFSLSGLFFSEVVETLL